MLENNRRARAGAEFVGTEILLADNDAYLVVTIGGNVYSVCTTLCDLGTCDCPDFWRLQESGATGIGCKHIYMVQMLLAAGDTANWSAQYVAEVMGVEVRTVENLCAAGKLPGTIVAGVWKLAATHITAAAIDAYMASFIGEKPDALDWLL